MATRRSTEQRSHPDSDPPSPGTGDRARLQQWAQGRQQRAQARLKQTRGADTAINWFEREQGSGSALLSGGLAYRLFFWLVAFGLVIAAVASFWVRESQGSLQDAAKSFGLSGVAARSAAGAVESGSTARWYLLGTGLVLLVYFGIGAVRALRIAAFIAWQLKPTRLRQPIRASAAFTGIFVLGLVLMLGASWIRDHTAAIGLVFTCGAIVAFIALAVFTFLELPRPEGLSWTALVPGAVLVGFGITAVHVFVVYYLAQKLERSPKLYGTLGASTVVLVGLFLIARVVISAMFLNATLYRRGQADR